ESQIRSKRHRKRFYRRHPKKRITNELFADYRVSQRTIQSAFSLLVHTREKKLLDLWNTWFTHWSLYCLLF
ncbi:MAG: hypothetical protein QMC68_07665, partial [Bacteroidia bacterium]